MRKMLDFEEQKAKYLKRSVMERKSDGTITLNFVDNWQEYYIKRLPSLLSTTHLPSRKGYTINAHANDVISLFFGDVTQLLIDVLVYTRCSDLCESVTVNHDIHEKAGHWLYEECKAYPMPEIGEVIMTGAYRIPAKYIFHARSTFAMRREKLRLCYKNSLDLAKKHKLKTIAFPCLATGYFGYPEDLGCHVALEAVRDYIDTQPNSFERILFCMDALSESRKWYDLFMPFYFPVQ